MKLNKLWIVIEDVPYVFISTKTREEMVDFCYHLHEKWDINDAEEEPVADFINFFCENLGTDEVLICLDEECLENYRYTIFDF